MSCRILFGGMPSAGKSTLVCSVYEVLTRRGLAVGLHELDIWSDTHDCILGRKPWEQRAKRGGSSKEQDDLHPEFATAVERFRADPAEVVIGDLPGCSNGSWDACIGCADYGVLVMRRRIAKDDDPFYADRAVDWERQMDEWEIPVIARTQSLLDGDAFAAGTNRIGAAGLDRTLALDDPGVLDLATLITRFAETPALQTA